LIEAIRQLRSAIDFISPKLPEFSIHARVVLTKEQTVDVKTSEFRAFIKWIREDKKGTFDKANNIYLEKKP
jgi:hypothetical protein